MLFELPLNLRQSLWSSGFAGVDCALRFAVVELDLYMLTHAQDLECDTDAGDRHFANFLAWADSVLIGINDAVTDSRDHSLRDDWKQLRSHPLRELMRENRNAALKRRSDVIGWEYFATFADGGAMIEQRFQLPTHPDLGHAPVLGTANDYLHWIRDSALPLLLRATITGTVGTDTRRSNEMPFPSVDPWTTRADPEIETILSGLDVLA